MTKKDLNLAISHTLQTASFYRGEGFPTFSKGVKVSLQDIHLSTKDVPVRLKLHHFGSQVLTNLRKKKRYCNSMPAGQNTVLTLNEEVEACDNPDRESTDPWRLIAVSNPFSGTNFCKQATPIKNAPLYSQDSPYWLQ